MAHISNISKLRKSILAVSMAVILVASFLTGSMPAVHAQGTPALFSDASAADAAADHAADVARSRYVNVNMGLLMDNRGQARDAKALPEVTLNLFPDANYTGLVDRVETNRGTAHPGLADLPTWTADISTWCSPAARSLRMWHLRTASTKSLRLAAICIG